MYIEFVTFCLQFKEKENMALKELSGLPYFDIEESIN